ncbi:hypothetical protein CDCA_CDCA15G3966 [Cyanidium caldarium]|uniref:60S ribosomal protein L27 n=1 Tax=Cyanidium caldarium TaxID=2771 RepID=A0AAV9J0X1_CYACA|nr:hypothetical protein CDCA_CDCA15G3966 [Cyanidium caldarium]
MVKFLKPGKIVLLTSGRYAGRKAVIVRNYDDGTSDRGYGHALVAGISRYPKRVTRRMSDKRIAKRIKIRPFVKFVNYSHLMPTRYVFDAADALREQIHEEAFRGKPESVDLVGGRKTSCKAVRKVLEERHQAGKNRWFFAKLRF